MNLCDVCLIIVTYNRASHLKNCLLQALQQTTKICKIIVVDNASTDETSLLLETLRSSYPQIEHVRLSKNLGGSGGFSEGLKYAVKNFSGWFWLMDDDAAPEPEALKSLLDKANNSSTIYASTAIGFSNENSSLCWPVSLISKDNITISFCTDLRELPEHSEVFCAPFLGFFIHSKLVKKIGLPEKEYFVSGDDTEYCIRARKAGISIHIVSSSIIRHPLPPRVFINIFSTTIMVLLLPPWKRYYDTRNRFLIAKKHFGFWVIILQTLPSTFLRWIICLKYQPDKLPQTRAFFLGTFNGILGKKSHWIIK